MEKHFVVFLSAGTFVAEQTTEEIDSWDTNKAVEMAKNITERYNSKPYGFYFITKARNDNELDSSMTQKSNMYYINGVIKTVKQLEAENDPNNDILINNMKSNGWEKIIETHNPWKWSQPLRDGDVVLQGDIMREISIEEAIQICHKIRDDAEKSSKEYLWKEYVENNPVPMFDYDEDADILYVVLKHVKNPRGHMDQQNENAILRYDKETRELIGVTILDFMKPYKDMWNSINIDT
jgi:uncharacterized protein YuzE